MLDNYIFLFTEGSVECLFFFFAEKKTQLETFYIREQIYLFSSWNYFLLKRNYHYRVKAQTNKHRALSI